jgi:hypothetical protein
MNEFVSLENTNKIATKSLLFTLETSSSLEKKIEKDQTSFMFKRKQTL